MDRDRRARNDRGRDEERRGGRDVAGDLELGKAKLRRALDGDAGRPSRDPRAGPLEKPFRVVARRAGLDDGRTPLRLHAGEQDRRLHLRRSDRQLVVDRAKRAAFDDERRVAFGRLDGRAHPTQRLGDALHRAPGQRLVADELEPALLAGDEAGEQAHERARVAAVDRRVGRAQPAEPDAAHAHDVVAVFDDLDPERANRRDGRLRVGGAPEAGDQRLPLAHRPDENGAMRERLVARHAEVPDESRDGFDAHEDVRV